MRQKRSLTLLALGLAATFAVSAIGWADSAPDGAPGKPHGHQWLQKQMNLTDQQMTTIREAHARHAPEMKQLGQSLREARLELNQAALNGGDIKGKAAVVAALLGQITELHATTLSEIAPILSPEQRDAMAKLGPRGHWHRGPRPSEG